MKYAPKVALSLGALFSIGAFATGCIEDTDCGICDPDNLIVESISGLNYTSDKIHILNPPCEGDRCPGEFNKGTYFIEEIGPCEETEEALETPSPEEFCKISPLVTAFGVEFVFNNLLDPQSIELVRKRPDNPQLFEVYDWKSDVLHIEGPITRFNGDYFRGERENPDLITRAVNLACIDNLNAAGIPFGHEQYEDPATNPCNTISGGKPAKMFENGSLHAYRGIWTTFGNSCSSPEEGPDTCCTFCEWLLTTTVARYGIDENGIPRNPLPGALIQGDPNAPYAPAIVCREGESEGMITDKYAACSGFIPSVDRTLEEQTWRYMWCDLDATPPDPLIGPVYADCPLKQQDFKLPLADMIRQTHPDLRPRGFEKLISPCTTTNDCGSEGHNLSGTECVGINDTTGVACLADAYPDGGCSRDGNGGGDPAAVGGFCRPQWMVICADNVDTTGGDVAYCMDRRYATTGSAACKRTTAEVENTGIYGGLAGYPVGCDEDGSNCVGRAGSGSELALCDWNENGRLTGAECCVSSIAGPAQAGLADGSFACDPFYQSNLRNKPSYERDQNLPEPTKNCICPTDGNLESHRSELEESGCLAQVEIGCFDEDGDLRPERAGQFAVKFVARVGGIVYDPAIKGIDWRAADTGGVPRADVEECAENNVDRLVSALNRHDGWRANDPFTPENFEDFDRAMCSGQEYRVVFNEPGNDENPAYVVDKVGNTLAGKSEYTFRTPEFHIEPGSGFPSDNLRIGACNDFSIRFSNKYDLSPENLNKIQLYRVECTEEEQDDGTQLRVCDLATPDPSCNRDIDGDGTPDPPPGACCEVGVPVAGGPGCALTDEELTNQGACGRPCLTVDVENQFIGELGVEIDPTEFGQVLDENQIYRMIVPAAETLQQTEDPAIYSAVFWDVCGMPLVTRDAVPYQYEFKIDEPKCKEDQDRDGIPFSCDNADKNFNPGQEDIDADGIGDIVDLCPVAGGDANNTADSDDDGVGNDCDSCRQTLTQYNDGADNAGVPVYMQVRNIPFQFDADEDGIGDVCDNCVRVPNCQNYGNEGTLEPFQIGDPLDYNNDDVCQRDTNSNLIGDVCEGQMLPGAAGPVGFGPDDDFDQDGLPNMIDGCPRQPVEEVIMCPGGDECPEGRSCTGGVCNHIDSDSDGIGNICDTCAFSPNPNQSEEGGMQEDDPDSDFVGSRCETAPNCGERKDPRPFGFYPVQANGFCCTQQLVPSEEDVVDPMTGLVTSSAGDLLLAGTCTSPDVLNAITCTPLLAPHPEEPAEDLPVRTAENCPSEQVNGAWVCRALPPSVATVPGILTPPPGCEEALAAFGEGITAVQNLTSPLTDRDFGDEANPFDALWQNLCFLPQVDQDYDGWGDDCDLCPFDFDPANTQYIDSNGRLWPMDGALCNGDYLIDNRCELKDQGVGEDTEGMGSSGGGSSSSGGGGSGGDEAGTAGG